MLSPNTTTHSSPQHSSPQHSSPQHSRSHSHITGNANILSDHSFIPHLSSSSQSNSLARFTLARMALSRSSLLPVPPHHSNPPPPPPPPPVPFAFQSFHTPRRLSHMSSSSSSSQSSSSQSSSSQSSSSQSSSSQSSSFQSPSPSSPPPPHWLINPPPPPAPCRSPIRKSHAHSPRMEPQEPLTSSDESSSHSFASYEDTEPASQTIFGSIADDEQHMHQLDQPDQLDNLEQLVQDKDAEDCPSSPDNQHELCVVDYQTQHDNALSLLLPSAICPGTVRASSFIPLPTDTHCLPARARRSPHQIALALSTSLPPPPSSSSSSSEQRTASTNSSSSSPSSSSSSSSSSSLSLSESAAVVVPLRRSLFAPAQQRDVQPIHHHSDDDDSSSVTRINSSSAASSPIDVQHFAMASAVWNTGRRDALLHHTPPHDHVGLYSTLSHGSNTDSAGKSSSSGVGRSGGATAWLKDAGNKLKRHLPRGKSLPRLRSRSTSRSPSRLGTARGQRLNAQSTETMDAPNSPARSRGSGTGNALRLTARQRMWGRRPIDEPVVPDNGIEEEEEEGEGEGEIRGQTDIVVTPPSSPPEASQSLNAPLQLEELPELNLSRDGAYRANNRLQVHCDDENMVMSSVPEFVTIRRVVRRVRGDGSVQMVTYNVRVRPERVLANGDVVIKRKMRRAKDDGCGMESLTVLQVIPRKRRHDDDDDGSSAPPQVEAMKDKKGKGGSGSSKSGEKVLPTSEVGSGSDGSDKGGCGCGGGGGCDCVLARARRSEENNNNNNNERQNANAGSESDEVWSMGNEVGKRGRSSPVEASLWHGENGRARTGSGRSKTEVMHGGGGEEGEDDDDEEVEVEVDRPARRWAGALSNKYNNRRVEGRSSEQYRASDGGGNVGWRRMGALPRVRSFSFWKGHGSRR